MYSEVEYPTMIQIILERSFFYKDNFYSVNALIPRISR
jgi:hypothetical protein